MQTLDQLWNSLSGQLQRSLIFHVRHAENGEPRYTSGRWRSPEVGQEALEKGIIEKREHPTTFLTDTGWKVGRHGLKLEKEEDGKEA